MTWNVSLFFLSLLLLAEPAGAGPEAPLLVEDARLEAVALQESLEHTGTNDVSIWSSSDGDPFGTITPVSDYRDDAGTDCREYRKTVVRADREHRAYGAACRAPDGVWWIVGNERVEAAPPRTAPPVERTVIHRDRVVIQPIYVPVAYYYPAAVPLWAGRGLAWRAGSSKFRHRRTDVDRGRYRVRHRGWTESQFLFGGRARGGHGKSFRRAGFRGQR